ncbi:MAG: response regulator [Candidatus Eremiobacteraeota bacterium]|nr:response regulator [Candidatus Eremiobacteraeota bacterium]
MNSELSRNILIVEDDEALCDNLSDILEMENYIIKIVGNAEDAYRAIENSTFPVVLLDLRLPGQSGTTILKRIKKLYPDTQVIIMTAHASVETAIDALEQDAFAYLRKPVNIKELIITIGRASQDAIFKMEKELLLQQLTVANEKMKVQNRELEERNDDLASFIYTVSHELKSSLVTFQGYLQFINEMELDSNLRGFMKRLQVTTEKMGSYIKDLLQISRVRNIIQEQKIVKPEEIIREIIEDLPPGIKRKDADIIVDDNFPEVLYNPRQMKQVFENLITNALNFIDNNTKPRVEAGWYEDSIENKYVFFIKDNGIGIEQAYHNKIFDIFQQLGDIPNPEGTGVGLSIVKRIINRDQEKIWVESEKGKGSSFYFTVKKPIKQEN